MKFGPAPASSEIETSVLPHASTSPEINRPTGPTTMPGWVKKIRLLNGWKKAFRPKPIKRISNGRSRLNLSATTRDTRIC